MATAFIVMLMIYCTSKCWIAENFLLPMGEKTEILVHGPKGQREKLFQNFNIFSHNKATQEVVLMCLQGSHHMDGGLRGLCTALVSAGWYRPLHQRSFELWTGLPLCVKGRC